ncbi:MAG: DNA helicase PcrA [Candidatus Latescibacteria bacterium]|nr:DNA helicase PcrA [Candidatus Latescibacterota bacterium]
MSILDALNPPQREAASTVAGPLLVLAGAGSGKTRVLTYRIAHLVRELDVAPWRILAVTFTNKAAGEMRERIEQLIGDQAEKVWIGTFHAICARLLRYEAQAFGLDPNFTIYDEDDRRALMRRLFAALNLDDKELAPRSVISQISSAKNAMIEPLRFTQEANGPRQRQIGEIYTAYETALRQNNAFDFDDLLVEVVRQFDQHKDVLARYQDRFQYILIDEYQDTNRPQYLLSQQLAGQHRNICCVGDDDQSIYQFRGADIRNILDFEQDYPEAHTVRLEQNYRSTGNILAAANAVIGHNKHRKGKELWTQADPGDRIDLVHNDTDRDEARFIIRTIQKHRDNWDFNTSEIAILYRTNAQSRPLEEELQRARLPYTIVGGIRFYERKEVKDLLAYLRLLVNPSDAVSLQRVINVPKRGIGGTTVERVQNYAREQGFTLYSTLGQLDQVPGLNARARKHLDEFYGLLKSLRQRHEEVGLEELVADVLENSGYRAMLHAENTPEAEARRQNVEQLQAFISEYAQNNEEATLTSFLEETALMTPQDDAEADAETAKGGITLMTLHSAKGLEYPLVFICGLEEKLFPTLRAIDEEAADPQAIEEERRLFYVGITRAERRLYITYARLRYTYGNLVETLPSRFLEEIPQELLKASLETRESGWTGRQRSARPGRKPANRRPDSPTRPSKPKRTTPAPEGVHYEWDEGSQPSRADFDEAIDQEDFLAVGRWVLHGTWGRGQITARQGSGAEMKLSIRFSGQTKRVAVAYAQLEPA